MNDFDLESELKTVRVPQRDREYWEEFPQRVLAELRTAQVEPPARCGLTPGFWWSGRLVLTCLMLGFCLWQSRMPVVFSHALLKDEKEFRQSVHRMEHNLGRLMQDEHGLHSLIEDKP